MKFPALASSAATCALVLTGCAAAMDDNNLMKNVPVGSGTSHLEIYPFIECVKAKWAPQAGRLRQYPPDADGQVLAVRSASGSGDDVLLYAQPSPAARNTGYTIYGDIAAARYVSAAHACD